MEAPSENLHCRAATRVDVQKRHSDNVVITHMQHHEIPCTVPHLMRNQAVFELLVACQAVDLIELGLVKSPPPGHSQTPILLNHVDPLPRTKFLRFHPPQLSLPVSWRVNLRHISLGEVILQDHDPHPQHQAPADHLPHHLLELHELLYLCNLNTYASTLTVKSSDY